MPNLTIRPVTPKISAAPAPAALTPVQATHVNVFASTPIYGTAGNYYFIWNNRIVGYFCELVQAHLRIDFLTQRQNEWGSDI